MEILEERDFVCSICGKHAGRVELSAGKIVIESFVCHGQESSISSACQEAVQAAVRHGSARALFEVDEGYAPFFCPRCSACYCGECWRHWDVFEDDGWFDCVRGCCPRGHERMLVD